MITDGLSARAARFTVTDMSLKNELLKKLLNLADNPVNEFDRIIHNNKECLTGMSEKALSEIYTLRRRAEHLCRLIPYSREDIAELVESGAVSTGNRVAELEDCFLTAEYIFEKERKY